MKSFCVGAEMGVLLLVPGLGMVSAVVCMRSDS